MKKISLHIFCLICGTLIGLLLYEAIKAGLKNNVEKAIFQSIYCGVVTFATVWLCKYFQKEIIKK